MKDFCKLVYLISLFKQDSYLTFSKTNDLVCSYEEKVKNVSLNNGFPVLYVHFLYMFITNWGSVFDTVNVNKWASSKFKGS